MYEKAKNPRSDNRSNNGINYEFSKYNSVKMMLYRVRLTELRLANYIYYRCANIIICVFTSKG